MPYKYAMARVHGKLENMWKPSLEFLQQRYIRNINILANTDGTYRKVTFKTKPSIKCYGFSPGEKYNVYIEELEDGSHYIMVIECKYSMFGRGFFWRIPQENLNIWTEYVNFPPMKFNPNPTPEILQIMVNITRHVEETLYCPICGSKISSNTGTCEECRGFAREEQLEY